MDASITSSTEFAARRVAGKSDACPARRRVVVAIDRFDHWSGEPVALIYPSGLDLADQAA